MANQQYGRRRRSSAGPTLAAIGIIVAALAGGAFLLHTTGTITIPFLASKKPEPQVEPDLRGKVRVPISATPIGAYEAVAREHVVMPRTQRVAMVWLDEETVLPSTIMNVRDVLGRVLRNDKAAGVTFLESDFYPKGTRPGLTAGIPPGQRAMRLKATDVPGLHGLNRGDHFDITMTVEVEIETPRERRGGQGKELDVEGPYAALHAASQQPPPAGPTIKRKRAEVRLVVEDGLVVQPVERRQEISTKTSLFRGNSLQAKPVEEIVIAIDPEEVAALNQALAVGAHIQVAMRTGQTLEEGESTVEGRIPDLAVEIQELVPGAAEAAAVRPSPTRLVEVIDGGIKRLMAVPVEPRQGADAEAGPKPEGAPQGGVPEGGD
jgi:Flp pilus assembly protein CpaB